MTYETWARKHAARFASTLESVPGLTQKAMFGGWAWLVNGNLLWCSHRQHAGPSWQGE